jgi:hypothetical protein
MKAKKMLIDSGLLGKDFSTTEEILERRKNLFSRKEDGCVKLRRLEHTD